MIVFPRYSIFELPLPMTYKYGEGTLVYKGNVVMSAIHILSKFCKQNYGVCFHFFSNGIVKEKSFFSYSIQYNYTVNIIMPFNTNEHRSWRRHQKTWTVFVNTWIVINLFWWSVGTRDHMDKFGLGEIYMRVVVFRIFARLSNYKLNFGNQARFGLTSLDYLSLPFVSCV